MIHELTFSEIHSDAVTTAYGLLADCSTIALCALLSNSSLGEDAAWQPFGQPGKPNPRGLPNHFNG